MVGSIYCADVEDGVNFKLKCVAFLAGVDPLLISGNSLMMILPLGSVLRSVTWVKRVSLFGVGLWVVGFSHTKDRF